MRRALAVLLAAAVITSATAGRGQEAGSGPVFTPGSIPGNTAPPATPTFRSSAEGVALDVFVTDAAGQPARGLTIDDFQIFENGKPQPITTFGAVDLPLETPADAWPLAEPDVASNEEPEGRIYVIALAAFDPCQALRTRKLLRDFIEHQFGPNDVATVVSLLAGLATDGQAFTSNRRLLLTAIDKFSGEFQGFDDTVCDVDPHGSRGRNLVSSFKDLLEVLGRMPGRHKSLVYVNEGPGFRWGDLEDYQGGVGTLEFDEAHRMMTIATRSNVAIYPIAPQGLTTAMGRLEDRQDFRALATMTGGLSHINSNEFAGAFERIVRDASVYYMLGFNSAYSKRNGKFVRLEVKVTRPGLTVRTRTGYVNATERERQTEARGRVVRGPVSEALASPLSTTGHPLRLTAAAFKGTTDKARVVLAMETALALETDGPGAETRRGRLGIRYLTTDGARRSYPEVRHIGTVALSGGPTSPADTRVRVLSEFELGEGRYQLRVAAGAGMAAGSVVYDLEVPNFNTSRLTMSSLILTSAAGARLPTLRAASIDLGKGKSCNGGDACKTGTPRDIALHSWSPKTTDVSDPLYNTLPDAPTTSRTFGRDDTVTVFTEVYPRQPLSRVASVQAELRRADESVALTMPSTAGTDAARASGGYGYTMQLPLATLEPGKYLLHVEARSTPDNQHTSRDIPLTVVP